MTTTFRTTAEAIAYALGEPPQRVDWALAIVYDDGEIRYIDTLDEDEARERAAAKSLQLFVDGPVGHSGAVRAFAAFQEVRMLPDGTQIIGPWMPADQFFTEGK